MGSWSSQFWQYGAAEVLRVSAYGLAALALTRVFSRPQATVFGRRRWLVVALLLALATVQSVVFIAWHKNLIWLVHDAGLFSSCGMLIISLSLWPFLTHIGYVLGQARDREMRVRLEQAERRAEQARGWLLLAEEIAHVGHWRVSYPEQALFWSNEIFRIHGLDRASFIPDLENAIAAFHPQDREMVASSIEETLRHSAKYELEARLVRPDGEVRYVLSRGVLQTDEHDAATALFGVLIDITEQKLIEGRLLEANAQAALTNQSLLDLAMLDSLTGLPNRRQFDLALHAEAKRAWRNGTGLGLIMIDLDYFKQYNDCYGHPAGDECLRQVAAAISGVPQRPGDLVARFGGEEFVILLPDVDAAGAETVARRIIEVVAGLRLEHLNSPDRRVTISCGAAASEAGTAQAPAELVRRADQALYAAKRGGRNGVVTLAAAPARSMARDSAAAD